MIRRFLPRFGAAAAALLLALPTLGLSVRADAIEPEPDAEEELVEPVPDLDEEVASEPEPVVEPKPKAAIQRETKTAAGAADWVSVRPKIFDVLILRPFGFATTVVGGVLFVPAAVLSAPSGSASIRTAWEHFVVTPAQNTFTRPLGDF